MVCNRYSCVKLSLFKFLVCGLLLLGLASAVSATPTVSFIAPTYANTTNVLKLTVPYTYVANFSISGTGLTNINYTWSGKDYKYNMSFFSRFLQMNYQFDNLSALGENGSLAVNTAPLKAYNLTLNQHRDKFVTGQYARAINFSARSSANASSVTTGREITYDFWFRLRQTGVTQYIAGACIDPDSSCSGGNYNMSMIYVSAANYPYIVQAYNFNKRYLQATSTTTALTTGTWYHIVAALNMTANTGYIYLNGVKQTVTITSAGSGAIANFPASGFAVGGLFDTYSNSILGKLNGTVDNFKMFNRSMPVSYVNMSFTSNLQKYNSNSYYFTNKHPVNTQGVYYYGLSTSDGAGASTKNRNFVFNLTTNTGWWNASWKNERDVVISPATKILAPYVVRVLMNYSTGMRSDFGDVRFVNSTGAEMNYYLFHYSPSSSAVFMVQIPKIYSNKSVTLKMYYNNPGVINKSNGTNTFYIFDQFNYLNSNWWVERCFTGGTGCTFSGSVTFNGALNIQFNSGEVHTIRQNTDNHPGFDPTNYEFYTREKDTATNEVSLAMKSGNSYTYDAGNSGENGKKITSVSGYAYWAMVECAGGVNSGDSQVGGTWYYMMMRNPSSTSAEVWTYNVNATPVLKAATTSACLSPLTQATVLFTIWGGVHTASWDYIMVKPSQYPYAEPVITLGSINSYPSSASAVYHLNDLSSVIVDSSGNGYNLRAYNSPTYGVSGVAGTAIQFDGKSQNINGSINVPNLGVGKYSRTLCAWVKPSNIGSVFEQSMVSYGSPGTKNASESITVANSSTYFSMWGYTMSAPANLTNGVWSHICMVYNGSNIFGYVNGVGSNRGTVTLAIPSNPTLYIGGFDWGSGKYFNGTIDEVNAYSRALSAAEVSALYSSYLLTYSTPIPRDRQNSYNTTQGFTVNSTVTNLKNITLYIFKGGSQADKNWTTGAYLKYNSTGLTDGVYTFNVTAFNNSGYRYVLSSRNFIVDTVAPAISFIGPSVANLSKTNLSTYNVNTSINDKYLNYLNVSFNGSTTNRVVYYNNSLVLDAGFDNNAGIGDSATVAVDISPFRNNGSILKAPYVVGKYYNALSFNGRNQSVNFGNASSLVLGRSGKGFTIEAWVNPSQLTPSKLGMIAGKDSGLGTSIWFGQNVSSPGALFMVVTNSSGTVFSAYSGTNVLTVGSWQHLVFIYDRGANTVKLYRNGVRLTLKSSTFLAVLTNTLYIPDAFTVGDSPNRAKGYYPFNGSVEELRVMSRALSSGEVNASYYSNLYKTNATNYYLRTSVPVGVSKYNYKANALDVAGNLGTTEMYYLYSDNVKPTVSYISPSYSPAYNSSTTIIINVSATDANNITAGRLYMWNSSGTKLKQINFTGGQNRGVLNLSNSFTGLTDGIYLFNATANDTYNNANIVPTRTIVVDTIVPVNTFLAPTGLKRNVSLTTTNISIAEKNLRNLTLSWKNNTKRFNYTYMNDYLQMMYDFDNVGGLGEGATKVVDLGPKQDFNLTVNSNKDTFVTGKYGNALNFSGRSGANASSVPFGKELTYDLWFKLNRVGVENDIVGGCHDVKDACNGNFYGNALYLMPSNNLTLWVSYNNSVRYVKVTTVSTFAAGTWYHVIASINTTANTGYIYVNGVKQTVKVTTTGSGSMANQQLSKFAVGGFYIDYTDAYFNARLNGTIDNFRMFNRTMPVSYVNASYFSNLQRFNRTQWYLRRTETLPNSAYTFRIQSGDLAKNVNTTSYYTRIDVTPPAVTYNPSSTPGGFNKTGKIYVNATVSDPNNVTYMRITLMNRSNSVIKTINVTGGSWRTNLNYSGTFTGFTNGTYWINVTANDTFNNLGYGKRYITFDSVLPIVTYILPTSGNKTVQSQTYNISIVENNMRNLTWGVKNNTKYINVTPFDDHLQMMYDFDNVAGLGESTTKVVDLGPKQDYNLTVNPNKDGFVTGKYGNALNFTARSGANASNVTISREITYDFWFRLRQTGISQFIVGGAYYPNAACTGSAYNRTQVAITTGNNLSIGQEYNDAKQYYYLSTLSTFTTGTWYHVVASLNTTARSGYVYVNGVKQTLGHQNLGSGSMPNFPLPGLSIGGFYCSYTSTVSSRLNGTVDNFRMFNRTMPVSYVNVSYFSNIQRYNRSQWYWRMTQNVPVSTYNLKTYVGDMAKNTNASSISIRVDYTAPVVTFVGKTTATASVLRQTWIYGNASQADNSGNLNITVYVYNKAGTLMGKQTGINRTTYAYNFTGLADGSYYLNATAFDGLRNKGGSSTNNMVLDNAIGVSFITPTPKNGTWNSTQYFNASLVEQNLSTVNMSYSLVGGSKYNVTFYDPTLKLYVAFNNVSALGETGTRVMDSSSSYRRGTMTGSPTYRSGRYGTSMNFTKAVNYVNFTTSADLNLVSKFTVEAWMAPSDVADNWKGIVGTYTGTTGWIMAMNASSNNALGFWQGNAWYICTDSRCYMNENNQWRHVAVVVSGTQLRFYVNGINVYNATAAAFTGTAGALQIGNGGTGWAIASYGFAGRIDEVKVFNRTLTSNEMKWEYYSSLNRYNKTRWYLQSKLWNDGNQTFTVKANDVVYNVGSSSRQVVQNGFTPFILLVTPTTPTGIYNRTTLVANVSTSSSSYKNTRIYLFNKTQMYISKLLNATPSYYNFTGLPEGRYYINATSNDTTNKRNSTNTISYILSTTKPALGFIAPTNGTYLTSSPVTFNISSNKNMTSCNVTITGSGSCAVANWIYSGWSYRRMINVSSTVTSTNHPTLITFSTSGMTKTKLKADCSDLRVADINGNPMTFIYSSGCNTTVTNVYVKMNLTSGTTPIYVYYGNSGATSASSSAAFPAGVVRFYPLSGVTTDLVGGYTLSVGAGSPTAATGRRGLTGESYYFGGSDHFTAASTGLPTGASARTACVWMYYSGGSDSNNHGIYGWGSQASNQDWTMMKYTNDNIVVDTFGNSYVITPRSASWKLECFLYDGSRITTWENGVYYSNSSIGLATASTSLFVGFGNGFSYRLIGYLQEASIYNAKLSSAQLNSLYVTSEPTMGAIGSEVSSSVGTYSLTIVNKDASTYANTKLGMIDCSYKDSFICTGPLNAKSRTKNNTFVLDLLSPVVNYYSPTVANNTILNKNSMIVNVSIVEANYVNSTTSMYYGGALYSKRASTSKNYTANFTSLSNAGVYVMNTTALDAVGRKGYQKSRSYTIDLVNPALQFVNPSPSGVTGSLNAIVNISVNDANLNYVNFTWINNTKSKNITFSYNNLITALNFDNYTTRNVTVPLWGGNGVSGLWHLDETSGTRADSSGYGGTCTASGNVSYSTGKFGNDAYFSGNSGGTVDYLSCTTGTSLTNMKRVGTIAFWTKAKFNQKNTIYPLFAGCLGTGGTWFYGGYGVYKNVNSFEMYIYNNSNGVNNVIDISGAGNASQWIHVALTWDGTRIIGYRNGELIVNNSQTVNAQTAGCTFFIGGSSKYTNASYSGDIDEVFTSGKPLTAREIKSMVQESKYYDASKLNRNYTTYMTTGVVTAKRGVHNNGFNLSSDTLSYLTSPWDSRMSSSVGTVCMWEKRGSSISSSDWMWWIGDQDSQNNYLGGFDNAAGRIYMQENNNSVTVAQVFTGANKITDTKWHYICWSSSGAAYKIYIDGVSQALNVSAGANNGNWLNRVISPDNVQLFGYRYQYSGYGGGNRTFDDVLWFNRTLSDDAVYALYNSTFNKYSGGSTLTFYRNSLKDGVNITYYASAKDLAGNSNTTASKWFMGAQPIYVTFKKKVPADIDTTNLYGAGVNLTITYNMTSADGIVKSTAQLEYKTNNTKYDGLIIYNGTRSNTTSTLGIVIMNVSSNFTFIATALQVYPGEYPIDPTLFYSTQPKFQNFTSNSTAYKVGFRFMRNDTSYNSFEFMAKNWTTYGIMHIIYCNKSYTNGQNYTTSANCVQAGQIAAADVYNHSLGQYDKQYLISIVINVTSGKIRTVQVTNTSYFLFETPTGVWSMASVPWVGRANTIQYTPNQGISWINKSLSLNADIRQYTGAEAFWYRGCIKNTIGGRNCSSWGQDLLQEKGLPPGVFEILRPKGRVSGIVNISHTAALSPNNYAMANYTYSMTNITFSQVAFVHYNKLNRTYMWNATNYNGTYLIKVRACDIQDECSSIYSLPFYLYNNSKPPVVHIIGPSNGTTYGKVPVAFSCNASDEYSVRVLGIKIYNGSNVMFRSNRTNASGVLFNSQTWNYNFTKSGKFNWTCFAADGRWIANATEGTYKIISDQSPPDITFVSPTPNNASYTNKSTVIMNVSVNENVSLCATQVTSFGHGGVDWFNSSWPLRKRFNVTSSVGTPRGYQIKLVLTSSDVGGVFDWSRNCADIRFANKTKGELSYWVKSCDQANENASIWVKFDGNITSAGNYFYMYFGNTNAVSTSSARNTFLVYDDFANSTRMPGCSGVSEGYQWNSGGQYARLTYYGTGVAGGYQCTGSGTLGVGFESTYSQYIDNVGTNFGDGLSMFSWATSFNHGFNYPSNGYGVGADNVHNYYGVYYNASTLYTGGSSNVAGWSNVKVREYNGNFARWTAGSLVVNYTDPSFSTRKAKFGDLIGWMAGSGSWTNEYRIDNVMVRMYVSPEPTVVSKTGSEGVSKLNISMTMVNNNSNTYAFTSVMPSEGSLIYGVYCWDAYLNQNNTRNQNFTEDKTPPAVNFLYATPNDLDIFNILGHNGYTLSYNVTDNYNVNKSKLRTYIKTNSSVNDCTYAVNGTKICGYMVNSQSNITTFMSGKYNIVYDDNDIYPAVYNAPEEPVEQSIHKIFNLTGEGDYAKIELLNISSLKRYGFYEAMLKNYSGVGPASIYTCNSTYINGSMPNANCGLLSTLSVTTPYNHTHSIYSSHQVFILPINVSDGTVVGVKISPKMYFILKGAVGTTWQIRAVPIKSRSSSAFGMSTDNGSTYTYNINTADSHMHEYYGTENNYRRLFMCDYAGNCVNSTITYDPIGLRGIAPTSVDVFRPQNITYAGTPVPVNYTRAYSYDNYSIANYSIYLLNSDYSMNRTLVGNNGLRLNYTINMLTVGDGSFIVNVKACDIYDQCSNGYSQMFSNVNDIIPPMVKFVYPTVQQGGWNKAYLYFNMSAYDNLQLMNATIRLYNGSGAIIRKDTTFTGSLFVNYSSILGGTYQYNATAFDAVGNRNRTRTYNVTVDFIPPVPYQVSPANYTVTNVTTRAFTCNATDNKDITNMSMVMWDRFGNVVTRRITYTPYVVFNRTSWVNNFTQYGKYVWACMAGDDFTTGKSKNYTIYYYNGVPTISFIDPTTASGYSRNGWVNVNVSASDPLLQVVKIYIYNSSNALLNVTTGVSESLFVNKTGLADGSYLFNATVNNSLGRMAATGTNFVVLDTINPQLHFTAGADNNGTVTRRYINANVTVYDKNLQRAYVRLYNASGAIVANRTIYTTTNIRFNNLFQGAYHMNASAFDDAGRTNFTNTRAITVQLIGPDYRFISPTLPDQSYTRYTSILANLTAYNSVVMNSTIWLWNTTTLVDSFYCGASIPCFHNFSGLDNGIYYLNATGYDNLNQLGSSITNEIKLSTIPPKVIINGPATGNYTTSALAFNMTITGSAIDRFNVSWNNKTYSVNYSFYGDGMVWASGLDHNTAIGDTLTEVRDYSVYSNNGTITGATYTGGKYSNGMYFVIGGRKVKVNNVPVNIADGGKNTVEFWFYRNGHGGPGNTYPETVPFAFNNMYALDWHSYHCFGIYSGTGSIVGFDSAGLDNGWHHIAAVFYNGISNPSNSKIYIDGVQKTLTTCDGGQTPAYKTAASTFWVGNVNDNANLPWDGIIDEVRVWNKELNAAQISQDYHSNMRLYNETRLTFMSSQTVSDGNYTFRGYATSRYGLSNHSTVKIDIDTTRPTSAFVVPTTSSGYRSMMWIAANVTASDRNGIGNIVINLYNDSNYLVATSTSGGSPRFYNFTGLASGIYKLNYTVTDSFGWKNVEVYRRMTLDNVAPQTGFTIPLYQNTLYGYTPPFNMTITEANLNYTNYSVIKVGAYVKNYTLYDNSLIFMSSLDNNPAIGESGSVVVDVSRFKKNGTLYGSYVTGRHGKAISGYAVVGGLNTNQQIGGNNTVDFWTYYGSDGWLFDFSSGLGVRKLGDCLGVSTDKNEVLGVSGLSAYSGKWIHVVAVIPNGVPMPSTTRMFINGRLYSVAYCAGANSFSKIATDTVTIGGTGYTDEFKLFNKGISVVDALHENTTVLTKMNKTGWNLAIWDSPSSGNYTSRISVMDRVGLSNSSAMSYIVNRSPVAVSFVNPTTISGNTTNNWLVANVSASAPLGMGVIKVYIFNASGSLFNRTTKWYSDNLFVNLTDMPNGLFRFNVTANDTLNNKVNDTRRVVNIVRDGITIVRVTPSVNNSYIRTSSTTLRINLGEDPSYCNVNWNGTVYSMSIVDHGNKSYATYNTGALADAKNYTYSYTCQNYVGVMNTTKSYTLYVGYIVPRITIQSPVNNSKRVVTPVWINYTVVGYRNTWWGYEYEVPCGRHSCTKLNNYTYSGPVIYNAPDGINVLWFFANDTINNNATKRISFGVDTVHPSIEYLSSTPYNGRIMNGNSTIVNVTVSEVASACDLVVNGSSYVMTVKGICGTNNPPTCWSEAHINKTLPFDKLYSYYVKCNDTYGNWGNSSNRSLITSSAMKLSYISKTDADGLNSNKNYVQVNTSFSTQDLLNTTLYVFENGVLYNKTIRTSSGYLGFNFTDLPHAVFTFNVTAYNAHRNRAVLPSHTVGLYNDSIPPVVHIVSPAVGYTSASATPSFVCNITDDKAIYNVSFYVYNKYGSLITRNTSIVTGVKNVSTVSMTLPYQMGYNWTCKGSDIFNKVWAPEGLRLIYYDNQPPSLMYRPGTTGTYSNSRTITIVVNASDLTFNSITAKVYNGSEYLLNTSKQTGSGPGGTFVFNIPVVSDGVYRFNVTANDSLNRISKLYTVQTVIDTIKPNITWTADTTVNGTYARTWIFANITSADAHKDHDTIWLYRNGVVYASYVSYGSQHNFTNLPSGNYILFGTVYDMAGNTNSTNSRNITLNTQSPYFYFVAPTPESGYNSSATSIAVNMTTADSFQFYNLTLWEMGSGLVGSMTGTSLPVFKNFTGLTDGVYVYNLTANNSLGNRIPSLSGNTTLDTWTSIAFVSPTPPSEDNTNPNLTVSASIVDRKVDEMGISWYDGMKHYNTTMFDNNLIQMISFNNEITDHSLYNHTVSKHDYMHYHPTYPILTDYVSGRYGNGIELSTLDDIVWFGDVFPQRMSFTEAFWMKRGNDQPQTIAVNCPLVITNYENHRMRIHVQNMQDYGMTVETPSAGNWYYVAITFNKDNNETKVFINGNLTGYTAAWDPNYPMVWGQNCQFSGGVNYWESAMGGAMDEWRVWNRSLSPSDVAQLYRTNLVYGGHDGVKWNDRTTWTITRAQTDLTPANYTYSMYDVDEVGNVNNTGIRWYNIFDNIPPVLTYVYPTYAVKSFRRTSILVNVTAFDGHLKNVSVFLFNSSGMMIRYDTDTAVDFINFSGLADGVYWINASAWDSYNNKGYLSTRQIILDNVVPIVQFVYPSTNNDTNRNVSNVFANITSGDLNRNKIVVKLYTQYGLSHIVNSSSGASVFFHNFTGLNNGWYYVNASANDTAGNIAYTGTHAIYINTGVVERMSLNYTMPKVGCSMNNGCRSPGCEICTYPAFNTSKFQQYNVTPRGENMTMPFWNITNNGTVTINVTLQLNQTSYPGVKFKVSTTRSGGIEHVCSQTYTPSVGCMYIVDTSIHVLAVNVTPGSHVQAWLYSDFVGVPGGTLSTRNVSINVTRFH